jgi:uncharacterized membrane protein YecN with MAPEG domain
MDAALDVNELMETIAQQIAQQVQTQMTEFVERIIIVLISLQMNCTFAWVIWNRKLIRWKRVLGSPHLGDMSPRNL